MNPDSAVKTTRAEKRGAILEQRRRPTAKFQNDSALYHTVAMRLEHPLKATLIDERGEAQTCRLCCGKIAHRAFCQPQLRDPG